MITRFSIISVFVACVSFTCFGQPPPAKMTKQVSRQVVWELADTLSLAAIANAGGVAKPTVDNMFTKATAAGKRFGVVVPALPVAKGNSVSDNADALAYLLRTVGAPMGGILNRDYDEEHALLFELGLKSNILLVMYGPGEDTTNSIVGVIKNRSERLGLPPRLTADLLNLIAAKANFEKVKPAVFQMHRDVAAYLKTKP